MFRRELLLAAFAAVVVQTNPIAVRAETPAEFPTKPITLIVPWQASVTADLLLRGMAEVASKHLGQPVIVDNKAGASGTLGPASMAATAKPDGYTIAQLPITVFRLPAMQKMTYDPVNDFSFIIHIAGYNFGVVTLADGPFKKWQDVLEFAKANPGKVTYATGGPGTTPNIGMELIGAHSGVQFTHVPMKGGGESISAVLGGHVMLQAESPSWRQMVDTGKFRLLKVWGAERNPKWPDAPSLKELGYPFVFDSPFGLGGPKGIDPVIARKLHDAFKLAYEDPRVIDLYDKFEFSRRYMNSADYASFVPKLVESEKAAVGKIGLARKD